MDAALRAWQEEGPAYFADRELPDGQRPSAFWAPGLAAHSWWPAEPLAPLERRWREIRAEFEGLRRLAGPERVAGRGGATWTAYHLLEEGVWREDVCALCPLTAALLRSLPVCESALGYAYFSVLAPGAAVAPHHGASNAKLRGHLALKAGPDARIRVGGLARTWREGQALLFDDSFLHEVTNAGEGERVVLLVDLWHPDLTSEQVAGIARVFAPVPPKDAAVCENHAACVMARAPLMQAIAEQLPCAALGAAAAASARWRSVALDESLWRGRASREFGITDARHGSWRVAFREEATARFAAPRMSIQEAREAGVSVPLFKLVTLGDMGVGKTCFMRRLCANTFEPTVPTIGVDYVLRMVRCDGTDLRLMVWDFAGPERFRSLTTAYCRGAGAVALCYDCTDRRTFEPCGRWAQHLASHARPELVLCLVACKCDLSARREVSRAEGQDFADSLSSGLPFGRVEFAETSSLTGAGVERVAVKAVRRWMSTLTAEELGRQVRPAAVKGARRGCVIS